MNDYGGDYFGVRTGTRTWYPRAERHCILKLLATRSSVLEKFMYKCMAVFTL